MTVKRMNEIFRKFYRKEIITTFCLFASLTASKAQEHKLELEPFSIKNLVREVVSSNPEIQFYKETIVGAKAGVQYSSQWNDPELSFDVGYKRLRDSGGSNLESGAVWQVSVSQTFEWPGRISLRKSIAQRDVEMAQLGVEQFENALSARAKTLAFGLYAANAKATVIREVADRYKSLKETFLSRDSGGVTPLLETRVIEAGELALQRRATEAELAVQNALIELNLLRGADVDAPIKVKTPALDFKDAPDISSLFAAARSYNYSYRIKQVELEQQGFAVELSRNEQYPSITVSPYVSMDRVGEKETIVGLSVSLPLPLTDRTSSAVDIARSRKRQAETAAMLSLRELNRQVAISAKTYAAKLLETKQWRKDAVEKFRASAELADRHFRMGTIEVSTYVELQTSYLDAVEALLDTQNEILNAGLNLQEITGVNLDPLTEEEK